MDPSKTQRKRHPLLIFLGFSVPLVTILMGGGLFIAWISQGHLFYAYESQPVQAKVIANAPGALAAGPEDQRHFLVLAFDGWEDVRQGLRIPPATGVKAKHAALAAEIRSCLLPLKPGAGVKLDVEFRRARLSDQRTWRIKGVEGCDVTLLETAIESEGDGRCAWM